MIEKQTINKLNVKFLPLPNFLPSRSIFQMTSQNASTKLQSTNTSTTHWKLLPEKWTTEEVSKH